jgi:hypothetical protein
MMQDDFVDLANEMEGKRSETSRKDSPIMPENINSVRCIVHKGMFLS